MEDKKEKKSLYNNVKFQHESKKLYNPIINSLKTSTNLTKLAEKLKISKQNLNCYLRRLERNGFILKKGRGWYEVTESCKVSTQYGCNLVKDLTRGHAFIWKAKITKIPENWSKRIEILENHQINYKLVGAMKNIPRIKIYGRKVWLCNNHLKIWEKKSASFYGDTAIISKQKAFDEIKIIIQALENKLGINLRPYMIQVTREHYALIQNDLAIYHNQRGEIVRISDKEGEWLLIDDSLEMGGELENIGKKALPTHTRMKEWWNDHKKNNFEVTPTFILTAMNGIQQNQMVFAENMKSHIDAVQKLGNAVEELTKKVKDLK